MSRLKQIGCTKCRLLWDGKGNPWTFVSVTLSRIQSHSQLVDLTRQNEHTPLGFVFYVDVN